MPQLVLIDERQFEQLITTIISGGGSSNLVLEKLDALLTGQEEIKQKLTDIKTDTDMIVYEQNNIYIKLLETKTDLEDMSLYAAGTGEILGVKLAALSVLDTDNTRRTHLLTEAASVGILGSTPVGRAID